MLSARELAIVLVPSLAALASVLYVAWRWIDPAPPRRVVISTSVPDSGYERSALGYRDRLAQAGIVLEIRHSGGSLENLERLRDPASGVDAAYTTTGAATPADAANLASLGVVFLSPAFVFHRLDASIDRFSQLRDRRISVGTPGTYVRSYARQILEASGAMSERTALLELAPQAALDALERAEIDAAVFPAPLDEPVVQRAFGTPGLHLMSIAQADAVAKIVPVLTPVVLSRGLVSLARDEPPADVKLLATSNSLLVRRTLHPAVQYLLLQAMREVHSPPGPFHRQGEFPAPSSQDVPLSEPAARYYRSGLPWVYEHAPFALAVLLDRTVLVLIPFLVALIPILRFAPPSYAWLHRRRLWRLHRALADLERDVADDAQAASPHDEAAHAPLHGGQDAAVAARARARRDAERRLARIESQIASLELPLPFEDEVYLLKAHAALLRDRITAS